MGAIFHRADQHFNNSTAGAIVEIGSDRYEGSTLYFAQLAKRFDRQFHTVDITDQAQLRLAARPSLADIHWHVGRGANWAAKVWPTFNQSIGCLYLDNFDYDWNTKNQSQNVLEQKAWYKSEFGIDMVNQNCQVEHLRQMISLLPWMSEKCLVICDDTYQINECWVGKGGGVVLYLLCHGFEIAEVQRIPGPGFGVILTRG